MADSQSELEALHAKLDRLERDFHAELHAVRAVVQRLEYSTPATPAERPHPRVESPSRAAAPVTQAAEPDAPFEELTIAVEDDASHIARPTDSRAMTRFGERLGERLTDLLATAGHRVIYVLGPLGSLFDQAGSAYRHYRDQGKAPAFLMTLAGILAMTAGFGYLLQYSFNNFLGPGAKLAFGVVVGIGIIAGAARVHRANEHMRDYASSLIGLGVIVLYLCGYFAGPYYGLVPALGTLSVFASTVVLAYWLALRFQTRVVAVVTLGGGVLAPWLVSDPSEIEDVYAFFLVLLTAGSLHLARRLNWQPLTQLTFASTVAVVELLTFEHGADSWPLRVAAFSHFYLFFYFLLFNGLELKSQPARASLAMLTTEVAFIILVSAQTTADPQLLATLLIANAAVIGLPFFLRFTADGAARPVFLLAAGILLGYGLLSLAQLDYLGLLWGIEAVCFVYIGLRYRSAAVYYEGLVLLALSSASTLWSGTLWLLDWNWAFSPAWLAMLGLIAYLEMVGNLLRHADPQLRLTRSLLPWLYELQGVAGAMAWLGLVCIFAPQWVGPLASLPLFCLLYLASVRRLTLVQIVALLHICFLGTAVAAAGLQVGNFHFSEQPVLAQVARIELFAVLWLLQAFYERFYPESAFTRWSRPLRQSFYLLLPVFFLPKILRDFSAYLPIALWGSATIGWVLYRLVRSQPLRIETLLMILFASAFTFFACAADYLGVTSTHSYWALGLGLIFFTLLTLSERAFVCVRGHPLRAALISTSLYAGGALFAAVFATSESPAFASAVTAAYFALLAAGHVRLPFVRPVINTSYALTVVFAILTIVASLDETLPIPALILCDLLALVSWGYLLHGRRPALRLGRRKWGGRIVQQWLWQALVVLGYASINDAVFHDPVGPATSVCLVLQASAIVFLTLRKGWERLTWLALALFAITGCKVVFYDMADFSVAEKITALLAIGAVLLGAAYWYQQMRNKTIVAVPV